MITIATKAPVRWGILGTAHIAYKNWRAILNSGGGVVAAVASRDIERSRRFIAECQAQAPFESQPVAYGSYEALLASPEVDAVYLPLPTGVRKEWVIRAADAGKHVVCEKPCGICADDVREMLDACRRNNVQFMDGVMFMHSARLGRLREVLDDGTSVGAIKRIESAFSFLAPEGFLDSNIRARQALEPHGCVGDLGWYCIRFALWAMNWRLPREVSGRILAQHDSVPTEFSGELLFNERVSAGFYCSFLTENQQRAIVSGTKGYVELADFVLPFRAAEISFAVNQATFEIQGCDFKMQPNRRQITVPEHSDGHPAAQETNLFRNFSWQVRSGEVNGLWGEMALKTQQVLDACLESARNSRIAPVL